MSLKLDRAKATEEIRRIILAYPERIDRGDFDGVAELLGGVKMCGSTGILAPEIPENEIPVSTVEDVRKSYEASVILYEDGLPHTKHLITNIDIWFAEDGCTANSRSYFVVLQAMDDFPMQVIITGRYEDTYELDGDEWRLRIRREYGDLVGDISRHVTPEVRKQLESH
jgi:hypothetical protein